MTTEKNPVDLTLDEKRERHEADVEAWLMEGIALDKREQAFKAKYGLVLNRSELDNLPSEARKEWTGIYLAQQKHVSEGKVLQLVSRAIEKQGRMPGIGGFIGRLFGWGRRPGSYKVELR
ncbi:MAG: hypothetical protein ABSG88_15505 [Bradyrhizobium sp.]